jgi:SWIM zinc finger
MPATESLSEATIQRIAPDGQVLRDAASKKVADSFRWIGRSDDDTWLMAEYKGTEAEPYQIDVDLDIPAKPIGQCTCPSQKQPCKHILGLLFIYLRKRQPLPIHKPTQDMLRRRAERDAWKRQREAAIKTTPAGVQQVSAKKDQAQQGGLRLLDQLVLDLVVSGGWTGEANRVRMADVAAQLHDHYLPRVAFLLQRLHGLAGPAGAGSRSTPAQMLDLLAQLWTLSRKLGKYLEGRQDGKVDPILAEFLSDGLRMEDLIALGCIRTGLELLELAWERYDDPATGLRTEISHLIDIRDNTLYQAITPRPLARLTEVPGQASYREIVQPPETAVYPGWMTRRIRWEPTAEKVRPIGLGEMGSIHDRVGFDFGPVLEQFRQQCRNPLAPREATCLLGCEVIGKLGDQLVLEDDKGQHLLMVDRPMPPLFPAVATLERAAGYLRYRPAVLVRLVLPPGQTRIMGHPLAIFNPSIHLRIAL